MLELALAVLIQFLGFSHLLLMMMYFGVAHEVRASFV